MLNAIVMILRFIKKQNFEPGFFGLFLNPFYFIRRGLFINIRKKAHLLSGRLLDFGCGDKPYKHLFNVAEYIGLDIQRHDHGDTRSKIDVFYDGQHIPFEDEYFDSVFCSEVFEHVFNLDEVIPEIKRVMKRDGKILITVPFFWNEHDIPYDFGRYSSFGIKYLLEKHGFKVHSVRKSGNFMRVNFQLLALYFYSIFYTRSHALNSLLRMTLIIPVNLLGVIVCPLLPRNRSVFFNNIVVASK